MICLDKKQTLFIKIPSQIKIIYTKEKNLLLFSNLTKKILIIKNFNDKNQFQIYLNSKILIIQFSYKLKKIKKQLNGLYNIKFNQFFKQLQNINFKKILVLKGIGFKAFLNDDILNLKLGYSHDIQVKKLPELKITIFKNTKIKISSVQKDKLSQFVATLRLLKKQDPYTGKGILFINENIRRKEGKKSKK